MADWEVAKGIERWKCCFRKECGRLVARDGCLPFSGSVDFRQRNITAQRPQANMPQHRLFVFWCPFFNQSFSPELTNSQVSISTSQAGQRSTKPIIIMHTAWHSVSFPQMMQKLPSTPPRDYSTASKRASYQQYLRQEQQACIQKFSPHSLKDCYSPDEKRGTRELEQTYIQLYCAQGFFGFAHHETVGRGASTFRRLLQSHHFCLDKGKV